MIVFLVTNTREYLLPDNSQVTEIKKWTGCSDNYFISNQENGSYIAFVTPDISINTRLNSTEFSNYYCEGETILVAFHDKNITEEDIYNKKAALAKLDKIKEKNIIVEVLAYSVGNNRIGKEYIQELKVAFEKRSPSKAFELFKEYWVKNMKRVKVEYIEDLQLCLRSLPCILTHKDKYTNTLKEILKVITKEIAFDNFERIQKELNDIKEKIEGDITILSKDFNLSINNIVKRLQIIKYKIMDDK